MTPETVEMVQASFEKVAPIADKAADIFYNKLFEIAPQVRPMFPAEMADQKDKLMRTLAVAVQNLHQVETILPTIQELAVKHNSYGVKEEHYQPVGAALLHTLEKGLGAAWTPELEKAWTEVYGTVSSVMIAAANKAKAEAPKKGLFARMFG